MLEVIRSHIVV